MSSVGVGRGRSYRRLCPRCQSHGGHIVATQGLSVRDTSVGCPAQCWQAREQGGHCCRPILQAKGAAPVAVPSLVLGGPLGSGPLLRQHGLDLRGRMLGAASYSAWDCLAGNKIFMCGWRSAEGTEDGSRFHVPMKSNWIHQRRFGFWEQTHHFPREQQPRSLRTGRELLPPPAACGGGGCRRSLTPLYGRDSWPETAWSIPSSAPQHLLYLPFLQCTPLPL